MLMEYYLMRCQLLLAKKATLRILMATQNLKTLHLLLEIPGQIHPGADIGILDNLIIYENAGLPSLNYLAWWQSKYDKKNFSITAYAVDSLDQSFLINMRKYVNYIYITNDNLPNPWDTLPPYFNDMVGALGQ